MRYKLIDARLLDDSLLYLENWSGRQIFSHKKMELRW